MSNFITREELLMERDALLKQAKELVATKEATAEDHEKARRMMEDAAEMLERSKTLAELEELEAKSRKEADVGDVDTSGHNKGARNGYATMGQYLVDIWRHYKQGYRGKALEDAYRKFPDDAAPVFNVGNSGWVESRKDLVENVGADGGFLVFPEFRADMFMLSEFQKYVRERALVIPMRARQVTFPVLDQTGTTSGQSNLYGGVIPAWEEEAGEKDETEPKFRQMSITAHKLVAYTEASDELLADSAVGLEALLTRFMGNAIMNELDYTYIQGTGAGQPLGIVDETCGVTLRVARQAANEIQVDDIFNMLSQFMGQSPIWLAHQSTMPEILSMNGPAGNASYVWVQNVRDGMPMTLMGFPIYFIENCPTLGNEGDIILADWSKYVIGDREAITIDSSQHFRFRHDLTAWRSVSRMGGRPWLSDPLTLRDGATQVSPFVISGSAVAS